MRNGFLASVAALLGWTTLAIAQPAASGSLPTVIVQDPATVTDGDASGFAAGESVVENVLTDPPPGGNFFWARADYLLWWIKNSSVPALVTTGSPTDINPGALGQPGTSVLFGGNINNQVRSGGRFSFGLWFNDENTLGIEGGYFFLGQRSVRFNDSSAGGGSSPGPSST